MGLIRVALGAASGVLSDQWKEYFYCEALPDDVLVAKGKQRGKSGHDNIISNGSVIAVANGQCMMIVEQGKVVDLCAEPGEYTYDISTEPSIFAGPDLAGNLMEVFKNIGKRFTFGGVIPKDQRVYYFNTRELMGNKYGTPAPVPFRVVDRNVGLDIDISVRCFGEYSYRITNPMLFYTNICGNVEKPFVRAQLEPQLKSELLAALQPAFAKISEMGIRYSSLPGHTLELTQTLNDVLSAKWRDLRGIEIVALGMNSIKASEEDEKMIKELQRTAAFRDPNMRDAFMVGAQANAIQNAASNSGGAALGFMGMNMAAGAMGYHPYAAAVHTPAPAAGTWKCPACGHEASGKFCPECGAKKPEAPAAAANTWKCPSCGAENKGKFCAECGTKKPSGVPQYKCDKCGWEPADPQHPPKFCPECGDPFDDGDIVG